MPEIRIVLDPEKTGLGIEPDPWRARVMLPPETEVVVTGLPDGTSGGMPVVMFAMKMPSGDLVMLEMTWRLFSSVYHAFLGRFGEPEMAGMQVGIDDRTVQIVASDKPFVQCGECEWRLEVEDTEEEAARMILEYEAHYQGKHSG